MLTPLQLVAFYIAVNATITLILAINVVRVRVKTQTHIGDGNKSDMLQAIRAHGNNIEYVPLVLVMLIALALTQAPAFVLHIVGGGLALGRIAHGIGIATNPGASPGRGLGMMLTLTAYITAIVTLFMKAMA